VVAYFGDGDECHAAYHFPVMPRIYLAMAEGRAKPIFEQLALEVTPAIPDACGWFSFLRCHDELTLEMVTPEERRAIHQAYCLEPSWDFRRGEGVAARLANLFKNDARKIELAFSINFTLLGTPVIYYGDEFAKQNDEAYQLSQEQQTGYKDARYRCRGPVDWPAVDAALSDPHSLSTRIHTAVSAMLSLRASHPAFAGGAMTPVEMADPGVLAFVRTKGDDRVLCIHNLSDAPVNVTLPQHDIVRRWKTLYASAGVTGQELILPAHGFIWYIPA
jgi:maltose alpha-D-glucosyltransferase / alpha-amylase